MTDDRDEELGPLPPLDDEDPMAGLYVPELWGYPPAGGIPPDRRWEPDDPLGEEFRARMVADVRGATLDEDGTRRWPYGAAITLRIRRESGALALWALTVRTLPTPLWRELPVDVVRGSWLTGAMLPAFNDSSLRVWGTEVVARLELPPGVGASEAPLPWAWLQQTVWPPFAASGEVESGRGTPWSTRVALGREILRRPLILAGAAPAGWP